MGFHSEAVSAWCAVFAWRKVMSCFLFSDLSMLNEECGSDWKGITLSFTANFFLFVSSIDAYRMLFALCFGSAQFASADDGNANFACDYNNALLLFSILDNPDLHLLQGQRSPPAPLSKGQIQEIDIFPPLCINAALKESINHSIH